MNVRLTSTMAKTVETKAAKVMNAEDCGCLYAPDGSRLKHCGRGQQRAYPYTGEPTMHVIRADGWRCCCAGLRPRQAHQEPQQCLTLEVVAAWRVAHPEATCSERTARALAWLETFAR